MNTHYYFKVADFTFSVIFPFEVEIGCILPSYQNFVYEGNDPSWTLFTVHIYAVSQNAAIPQPSMMITEESNDMGHLVLYKGWDRYCLALDNGPGGSVHLMFASLDFKRMEAYIREDDPHWGDSLNSMIRFAFSQAILSYQALSIHASAVCVEGKAYLFTGRSGTGKSTHASLWLKCIKGARLLNDDNPTIRLSAGGQFEVYGTPWSGKTPCYINRHAQLKGIAGLCRAERNRFLRLTGVDAFIALLPGCMALTGDSTLYGKLCDTLELIAGTSTVIGRMYCLPLGQAALLCYNEIS
jgi:hypothetical protein